MEKLHELKEKLWAELDELVDKREMGAGDLEVVHKITDTIKNIDKICMLEDGEYSEAVDGMDYGRGSSYANRGKHYVRGHYSRDGGMDGYSSRRRWDVSGMVTQNPEVGKATPPGLSAPFNQNNVLISGYFSIIFRSICRNAGR